MSLEIWPVGSRVIILHPPDVSNQKGEETNVTITNNKSDFLQSVSRPWDYSAYNYYYNHILACNQSLLYGLKRALEISPAESVIMVFTLSSMADYNDTQLLSDVYTLLKEKKSQLFHSLELLLSKPLNSSVPILNVNLNVTNKYTKVFNVPTSLTHLLITGNEAFTLNFTDPHDYYFYDINILSSHLVKSPAAGSWVLNAQGNSTLSVQILGFTGKLYQWNCSNSDCHPNATCSEFGGYGQCTCKEGFAGDGTSCNDTDECQDYFTNNCNIYGSGYCVNTIGSYICNCSSGFKYKAEFGCVDIDECADSSLNDCDPVAICTNYYYGYYTCICPYGYYGDGRHCEVNECQKGTPCKFNEDCIKYIGSYSCIDPCSNHTVLNDPWRSTSNTYNYNYGYDYYNWYHCDSGLSGWYRFKGEYNQKIPEHCVPQYSCGTNIPIWMNGSHPAVSDGVVNRTACSNWYSGCCTQPFNISVRMCPEGFYVYKLQGTPGCYFAYCTESDYSCSGVECAPDEECRMVNGVSGCYCKDSSYTTSVIKPGNLTDYLTPQVTCGLGNIEVRFSKCLLKSLGYDTSSIHLRDNYCRGDIERLDKSYITLITGPTYGSCGGYISNDGTDITYSNTVYLPLMSDGVIIRNEYPVDFHCTYPSNMEINLLTAISSFTVNATINVAGTANFTITMGLFQDSGYITSYTSSQVSLNSTSMLYVGVIVTGATGSSPFVLVMKNCYATPTADSAYGSRYDIITDRCPNRKDPTISVPENGVSLKGRFSFQVFKFLGGYNQIYLHCQIGLCDTSSYDCSALFHSLEVLLSKPLNSSVPILNVNLNITDKYTEVFNVTTSLTYLLITGNELFTLNFTDPNGNTFSYEQNPYYSHYFYNYLFYYNYYHHLNIPSFHLVKSPSAGSWVLNAQGNSSFFLQIFGFTGIMESSGAPQGATFTVDDGDDWGRKTTLFLPQSSPSSTEKGESQRNA
ncbi:uromodulin-like [Mantella aurantiaca]